MATTSQIVDELMTEANKTTTAVRKQIEQAVGDIVLELLQQNDGRFRGLEKTQSITVTSGVKQYKLNSDFNTAKRTFHEVNSDGDFVAKCECLSKAEIFSRKAEGGHLTYRFGYIEFEASHSSGRGYYLTLAEEPTGTAYFEFEYYREPTREDADIIRKPSIVKHGVRGRMPRLFDTAEADLGIYLRRIQGFKESPERFVTALIVTPPPRVAKRNRFFHDIGRGQ